MSKTHFKSLIAIPVFMLCSIANAQWSTLSFPSYQTLDRASFPDDNTGFVSSANYKTLWRTMNGGTTWDSTVFINNVLDIDFISPDTGFVLIGAGGTGYELKITYNKGNTWTTKSIPTSGEFLQMVYFTTSMIGYINNYNAEIIKTIDGGTTWNATPMGTYGYLMDKEHINTDTLILTGADGTFAYKGAIHKSYNDGLTWEALIHDSSYTTFTGSHFLNGMKGYTVHSSGWGPPTSYLETTINGGITWTEIFSDTLGDFQDVFMKNLTAGYLAEATMANTGRILYSSDGITWNTDYTTPYPIRKFYNNGNMLYGIGDGGLVIKKNIMVGIEENELDLNGKIYPNPTSGMVNFNFSETVEFSLFDALGKNVLSQKINSQQSIDLNYLTNGIYLARIVAGYKVGSVKIILNH